MIDRSQVQQLIGRQAVTTDGTKIGKIGQVYLDDRSGQPEWITVNTGLFGTKESFVPLANANHDGDVLTVPYGKDQIKDAPSIEATGHLSEAEEQELYRYYGVSPVGDDTAVTGGERDTYASVGEARDSYSTSGEARDDYSTSGEERAAVSRDVSGPTTDDAMTRSEERLDVGTQQVEAGRARLRKWVETENVQVDVPVSREKARLVTEPVTDANRDAALSGPDLSEEEHEVVLSQERPVVGKETVPVERVRLETDVDTDVERVQETVGKERIELDGDAESVERSTN